MLEGALKEEPAPVDALIASVYFLEAALFYERYLPTDSTAIWQGLNSNTTKLGKPPTALLKNAGLAYLHVIKSKGIVTADFESFYKAGFDIFHLILGAHPKILWPMVDETEDEAVDVKVWCVSKFVDHWGQFLARKDAKSDSQYDTIKSIYETATGSANKKKKQRESKKTKGK